EQGRRQASLAEGPGCRQGRVGTTGRHSTVHREAVRNGQGDEPILLRGAAPTSAGADERRRLAARRRGPRAPPFGRRPRQFPAVPRPAPALYNAVLRPEGSMRLAKKALTFDDVLLVPAYSEILPRDTSLKTRFTRGIALNLPL